MVDAKAKDTALDMIAFIEDSPTAAHAAAEVARRLDEAGFRRIEEKDDWEVESGDQFYVMRDDSSVIAVRVGHALPAEVGFRIIGAHTDFPGLRIKPNGVYSKNDYLQLGVEIYGGPILHTWTDRDLGLAGRLVVEKEDGSHETMLFRLHRPVCRIPNLAPHIKPDKDDGLKINKQDHMPPVFAIGDEKALDEKPLLKLLAEASGARPDRMKAYEVEVYDLQPGAIGGMNDEFIFTRSFDNLASCHAAVEALLAAPKDAPFTQVVALFDNEEVGSRTMQGAGSGFLDSVLERLSVLEGSRREPFFRAMAQSMMISADGAHAVNPNYPEAHEPRHQPILNGGPVVKVNANERYTTQIDAYEHLRKCAEKCGPDKGVPLQTFVARTDVGTGSTIGPMTACRLGIRSIDIGSPMMSMHSVREMAGTEDQRYMISLMTEHLS